MDQNADAKGSKLSSREKPLGRSLTTIVLSAAIGLILFWQAGVTDAQPVLPTVPDADITSDGLHPLDPSIMGAAWVRPGADVSRYTRIVPLPTAIHFREVPDRWHNARTMEVATAFYVDEASKARLRELFRESFNEALLGVRSFEPADELGRDVVLVQGILTDVISGVPPYMPGSGITNIKWAWETNIVLELRDAMTYTVLARTVERQRVDGPFDATMVGALTPTIVKGWSRMLVRRLEELRSFYPSRLSSLEERNRE